MSVETDAAFFAVGWPSNADLVAAAGVAIERGYVVVDDYPLHGMSSGGVRYWTAFESRPVWPQTRWIFIPPRCTRE
jgi:hypothetical protein